MIPPILQALVAELEKLGHIPYEMMEDPHAGPSFAFKGTTRITTIWLYINKRESTRTLCIQNVHPQYGCYADHPDKSHTVGYNIADPNTNFPQIIEQIDNWLQK